jgi:hypothetical protein
VDHNNHNKGVRGRLPNVWLTVNDLLSQDKKLKPSLSNREEFQAKVRERGEDLFIDMLKHPASEDGASVSGPSNHESPSKSSTKSEQTKVYLWMSLFEDGAYFFKPKGLHSSQALVTRCILCSSRTYKKHLPSWVTWCMIMLRPFQFLIVHQLPYGPAKCQAKTYILPVASSKQCTSCQCSKLTMPMEKLLFDEVCILPCLYHCLEHAIMHTMP